MNIKDLLIFLLMLILLFAGMGYAHALTATATATVVSAQDVGHNPQDLQQITNLKHLVNSMLQQGCTP